jgi:uridine kinase
VIIIEGLYALYDPRILELLDLKVFVDTDFDICLARRLNRDILHRGRELLLSIQQWDRFVRPNYEKHIKPTMAGADILIPRGLDNVVGINMLASHIQRQLALQSTQHIKDFLALAGEKENSGLPSTLIVLDQTPQVRGIQTILSNHLTSTHDFIFYFDRVASMLVNRALDELTCYTECIAYTPQGYEFNGIKLPFNDVCSVSIIRGGECFDKALRQTIPTIRQGKLLLQSDNRTGEPQLHTMNLPPCINPMPSGPEGKISENDLQALSRAKVLLVDAQISSGAAATMATAILLDHGVKEEDIIYIAYSASEIGLRRLSFAYPKIMIVVARVDSVVMRHHIDTIYYGT